MSHEANPLRVVLIGPECTGKTVLAERLARHYGVPWSSEFARAFVDAHPRAVEYDDVDSIGQGQKRCEDEAVARAMAASSALVIHDTDLVSTVVYSRHYYGDCPAWIAQAAAKRLAGLYLLHDTDVPWTEDGYQRLAPERRVELLERFRATLVSFDAIVVMISGDWDTRFHQATAAIDEMVGGPQP